MDTIKETYRTRWKAVAAIERQELQNATLESRWQQLNAVIGMAIGLGIYKSAEDEIYTVVSPKKAIRTLKNRKSTFGASPPEHTETQPDLKSTYRLAVGFS